MFTASPPDLNALDLEAVKALLIDRHESYTATLNSRTSEIERLVPLVEKLQRMLFGAKSEKVLRQIDQLELQLEELQAASAIEELKAVAPADRPAPPSPFADLCPSIFLAISILMCRVMKRVPTAAAGCANPAKT